MSSANETETVFAVAATSSPVLSQHSNSTTSLPRELLVSPLRALYKIETFTFSTLPRQTARLLGLDGMAAQLWSRTLGTGFSEGDATSQVAANAGTAAEDGGINFADVFETLRKLGGFFTYITSRWSLACFTVAVILNRITIYGSTRRHLTLDWTRRLAIRIIPIVLFASQILTLLRAIRCQTSPAYPLFRYGNPGKRSVFDHAGNGGFPYWLGSTALGWETEQQSCSAVKMIRPVDASSIAYGSFSLLWPVFLRLCLSHFVEVLSCALQGRVVATEAGMSIFEHSLAFSEAESVLSNSIGLGIFGLAKKSSGKDDETSSDSSSSALHYLTRTQVLERMNVTPELLLILLISCCNGLTSNVLDVLGKQGRYRLANTSIWGICYMGAMVWGLLSASPPGSDAAVLKFPTVCIVGFVPHLLILLGILLCFMIYALALTITAFSLPFEHPQSVSLRERFLSAHEIMQGSHHIQSVRFSRYEDFYAALLKVGYAVLTAASEAVFLNEGRSVIARSMTWLEEDKLAEIETSRRNRLADRAASGTSRDTPFEEGEGVEFRIPEPSSTWESGYNHEKKIEKLRNLSRSARAQNDQGGVGTFRGAIRCYHGFSFFRGIFTLMLRWICRGLNRVLDRLGMTARPQWLMRIFKSGQNGVQVRDNGHGDSLEFWIMTENGELQLPGNSDFDVEEEMRKREHVNTDKWQQTDERRLDDKLYTWWKAGGSWGNQDQSPDYNPSDDDLDDTTSVITTSSSTASNSEWEDDESDGRRTPTQADPFPSSYSQESTPLHETLLNPDHLSRLLDPRDRETKQEARILAAHLATNQDGRRIMTRSQYRKQTERDEARVLLSSRFSHLHASSADEKRKPTPDEEFEILENLILTRRSEGAASHWQGDGQTWESGASGLGPDGPPCVVCQTNPRSIITWPCRCLCICEDCRVSLAMNNFGSCVTCRQEVGGFLRLWVP